MKASRVRFGMTEEELLGDDREEQRRLYNRMIYCGFNNNSVQIV
jgi:hypothetical protein